jgi:hypothetical protein
VHVRNDSASVVAIRLRPDLKGSTAENFRMLRKEGTMFLQGLTTGVIAISVLLGAITAASAPDASVLVGRWEGDLSGARVPGRVLVVEKVENATNGLVGVGTFGIKDRDLLPVTIKITVDQEDLWVEFTTAGSSSPVRLKLSGDSQTLRGSMRPAGTPTDRDLILKRK